MKRQILLFGLFLATAAIFYYTKPLLQDTSRSVKTKPQAQLQENLDFSPVISSKTASKQVDDLPKLLNEEENLLSEINNLPDLKLEEKVPSHFQSNLFRFENEISEHKKFSIYPDISVHNLAPDFVLKSPPKAPKRLDFDRLNLGENMALTFRMGEAFADMKKHAYEPDEINNDFEWYQDMHIFMSITF